MPTTKKPGPRPARRPAPEPAGAGTTAGTTAGPAGGTSGGTIGGTVATSGTSGYGVLGFFTVDAEGATVRFGIDQQRYFLDASAANYDALFTMLLTCWLDQRDVDLTYSIGVLIPTTPDAPRRIISLLTHNFED